MLTRTLKLTRKQRQQITALLARQNRRMRELRIQRNLCPAEPLPNSPEAARIEKITFAMEKLREETHTHITAILEADQQTAFTQWWELRSEQARLANAPQFFSEIGEQTC